MLYNIFDNFSLIIEANRLVNNTLEVLNVLGRNNLLIEESFPLINDTITEITPDDSIKGLSLRDRACIALGMKMGLTIYS